MVKILHNVVNRSLTHTAHIVVIIIQDFTTFYWKEEIFSLILTCNIHNVMKIHVHCFNEQPAKGIQNTVIKYKTYL